MKAKTRIKRAAKRIAIATDVMLVKAGRAAEERQRGRARKAAVQTTGKIAAVAATAGALAVAARLAIRRRRAPAPTATT